MGFSASVVFINFELKFKNLMRISPRKNWAKIFLFQRNERLYSFEAISSRLT